MKDKAIPLTALVMVCIWLGALLAWGFSPAGPVGGYECTSRDTPSGQCLIWEKQQ